MTVDGPRDVVQRGSIVEDSVRVDGQVAGVVGVAVPDTEDDECREEHTDEFVKGREEGYH